MYRDPWLDRSSPVLASGQELMPYDLTNKRLDWVMVLWQFPWHLLIILGNSLIKWSSEMVSRPRQGSSKDIHWLLLTWDDASVEITCEFRLTVAVLDDAGIETDGDEGLTKDAIKVGDFVGADLTRSKITLRSFCGRILSWWPGFRPAFTGFTNVCSSGGAAARNLLMCHFLLSGVQERHIGAYQFLYSWESTYVPPPYRASTSSFSSRSIRIWMVLTTSKTLPILKHWIRFSMALKRLYVILVEQTHYICTFSFFSLLLLTLTIQKIIYYCI